MSNLTSIEKLKLEKFFGMGSGYVLDFSNRTFQEFILETTNLDIYSDKYESGSGSKASRLRAFWSKESNYVVGKITSAMLQFWKVQQLANSLEITKPEQDSYDECKKISLRLKEDTIVEEIEVIREFADEKGIGLLSKSIKESIEKNEPETALDRLHTYVVKFVRRLCKMHEIEIKKDESLNAIFGKYVKFIVANGKIESQMAEVILKYSIQVIEAFNDIRNNRSFAHDNPILNYEESILIFNNITNSLKYIESVEEKIAIDKKRKNQELIDLNNLPF